MGKAHRGFQAEMFGAMERAEFYPHPVRYIQQRETHISKVFLTGDYAYKIKKPVDLEFLDFTTLEKRHHFCQQEVVLNRRLAHDVYLDVVPITRDGGQYFLSGRGMPVEYAVKMRQLPENRSMVCLLEEGKIDSKNVEELAGLLCKFYDQASTDSTINAFGSPVMIRTNCEENFQQLAGFVGDVIDERMFQIIQAATRSFIRRWPDLFVRRVERDKIRDCHGDLRTGHIYFADGIQIIDCIEFNERFRYGDLASDLAFLAMDLDYEGYPEISQSLVKAYVQCAKDQDAFVLLNFYKCYRALVRVKVDCFRLQGGGVGAKEVSKILRETERYMTLAYQYALQYTRPTLWVVCGLPASGKSTMAREMSKVLGAKVLRSDVIRKELFDVEPLDRRDVPFGEGIYSKGASSLTYGRLLLLAQEEIEKGSPVILDATYGQRHERNNVFLLAKDMDVNLVFVECICAEFKLKERLKQRELMASVSDARLHHFEQINALFEPLNDVPRDMYIKVDTDVPPEQSLAQILSEEYALESIRAAEVIKD